MSLQDIADLPATVAENQAGHVADTNKIIGGLKTVKAELEGRLSDAQLAAAYAPATLASTAVIKPSGGTDGQVLARSGLNVIWVTPSSGGNNIDGGSL